MGFRHDLHHHRRDGGIFGAYTFHGLAAHQRRHLLCSVSKAFMFFFYILRSSPARLCCINGFSSSSASGTFGRGAFMEKEAHGCFPHLELRRRQARDRLGCVHDIHDIPDWEGTRGRRGEALTAGSRKVVVRLYMRDKPTETEKKRILQGRRHWQRTAIEERLSKNGY